MVCSDPGGRSAVARIGATQAETSAALGVSQQTVANDEVSALADSAKAEDDISSVIAQRPPKSGADGHRRAVGTEGKGRYAGWRAGSIDDIADSLPAVSLDQLGDSRRDSQRPKSGAKIGAIPS